MDFSIVSGSENKELEPLLKQISSEMNVNIKMTYIGSVDIMLALRNQEIPYHAVWPANSLWIHLGDIEKRVKHAQSIMTSPVVFGIKKSLAQKLGFIGKEVTIFDILKAIAPENAASTRLRFMMTSATQSNSGANAYLGFLYALAGNPDTLEEKDLNNPILQKKIKTILSGINRSSGSSGWLKDLYLKGNYDAMVNYEELIIETNHELIKQNKEPLYVVYPKDGLVMADSPLGFISQKKDPKENQKQEKIFFELQKRLLNKKNQKELLALGRRVGIGGYIDQADPKIFNTEWGIVTKKILSPIPLPRPEIIFRALKLYQSQFRKPAYTIFALVFSGSMSGTGEKKAKKSNGAIIKT